MIHKGLTDELTNSEKPKATRLASMLTTSGIRANGFAGSFDQYAHNPQKFPQVVLKALDNIDVRHEVQRTLWPDIVIDGAIGDFMCQVSRHPWPEDIACLLCLFQ